MENAIGYFEIFELFFVFSSDFFVGLRARMGMRFPGAVLDLRKPNFGLKNGLS